MLVLCKANASERQGRTCSLFARVQLGLCKVSNKKGKHFSVFGKRCTFAAFLINIDMKTLKSKRYLYAAAALLLIVGLVYYYFLSGFSCKDTAHYVCIDEDDTQDSVCAKLAPIANGHSIVAMRALMRYSGYADHMRTGRYAVRPGESTLNVFRHIKNGLQTPVSLTIPEARTLDRLAGALSRKLMLDSATTARALADEAFCQKYGYDTTTIAALFVPNTYDIYWNVTLDRFMERMQKEHKHFWNHQRMEKAQAMGLTPVEVATMASIVDEETANNGEKPMIAGMYYNRLKSGMPLQADPTIKFAWKDFDLRRIYHKLLYIDSPYNTYKNTGLPPGPIKIASVKGIDAVLNHTHHDYLYMCAKEDFSGTHNFAKTYEEHLANAAKYSKALNERGIK